MTTLTDERIEAIRKRDQHVRKKCEAWASINTDWKPLLEDMPVSIGDANDALGDRAALLADRDHWKKRAEEAEARLQWRDISTAPKDGTKILVWVGNESDAIPIKSTLWACGAWQVETLTGRIYPTHWMPLPPEPKP